MTTDLKLKELKRDVPYTTNTSAPLVMVPVLRNATLDKKLERIRKTVPYQIEYAKDIFSDELWRAMEIRNLSQVRFAKKAKVSKQFLTKIFRGENCTIETMVRLAFALNYKVNLHLTPLEVECGWVHIRLNYEKVNIFNTSNWQSLNNTRYNPVTINEKVLLNYATIPSST